MMTPDLLRPETYLDPASVAQLDQAEKEASDHVDMTIDATVDMLRADPLVSVTAWAVLMAAAMTPAQLASIASYLLFRAAREKMSAEDKESN